MATAATAAKGVTSPSPFATLLRRSRFASYDQKIGQVYTTFGGDSHRGNYGLKRPLALRTREPHITIASVDSLQQQTEWSHAESEARWIRKAGEVARLPEAAHGSDLWKKAGPFINFQWNVDSDFALGHKDPKAVLRIQKRVRSNGRASTPNIDAMTPKQFQSYLEDLRGLRPTFRRFLAARLAENLKSNPNRKFKVRSSNLLEQSSYPTDIHRAFLSEHMAQKVKRSESRLLEQDVHPNGALAYTHLTDLEHYLWRQPLPGRAVAKTRSLVVSFAGLNARLPHNQSEGIQPIEWKSLVERGTDTGKGVSKFRVSQVEVHAPPQVVGNKPEGIADMDVRMWVSSHNRLGFSRVNHHLPWTREYVAQSSDAPITGTKPGMTNPLPPREPKRRYEFAGAKKSREEQSRRMLDSLYELLEKQPQGPPKNGDGQT